MTFEAYEVQKHYAMLKDWANRRQIPLSEPEFLPKFGVVCPGIAAGFLYRTDSSFGLIENLIANPDSDKTERDQALTTIVHELIHLAPQLKIQRLVCLSALPAVQARALQLGFEPVLSNVVLFSRGVEGCH